MEITQTWKIGDILTLTKELQDNSIDTIVTSPPYWELRDYDVEGQIGLESTLEEYHMKLLVLIMELKNEEQDLKAEMEAKARRGELEGISKYAIFDKNGKLVLDME